MEQMETSVSESRGGSELGNRARVADTDEMDLLDFLVILWKHKFLVVAGSVIPALIVWALLFVSPSQYRVTYTYDNWQLNRKDFEVFLDGFYSKNNLDRLLLQVKKEGLETYAELIGKSGGGRRAMQSLILFEPWPPYVDVSKMQVRDASAMEVLRQLASLMVKMTVTTGSRRDAAAMASIVRKHIENVTPLFDIERELTARIDEHRMQMASTEAGRFGLELSLRTKTNMLAQLKDIEVEPSDTSEGNVTLTFNVGNQSEYLPLGYHIRAAETRLLELREEVRQSEELYAYHRELVALNEKLLAELRKNESTEYTVGQFLSFVSDMAGLSQKKEVGDYLAAYIKRLKSQMQLCIPIAETPRIVHVDKIAGKKTGTVFAVFLVMSVFAAFLRERAHQRGKAHDCA